MKIVLSDNYHVTFADGSFTVMTGDCLKSRLLFENEVLKNSGREWYRAIVKIGNAPECN